LELLALVPEECALAQEAFCLSDNEYEIPFEFEDDPKIVDDKFAFIPYPRL
jgi:hypothetical protein